MFGFHSIEVVVSEHIQEGEHTAIDPSSTLFHEILVSFHGVSLGDGIRHVL